MLKNRESTALWRREPTTDSVVKAYKRSAAKWMNRKTLEEVKKENEPYYDDNYLCLVQISDSEINKK